MIGRTLAHFQITAKLGEGGMGEVYRAQDTRLGREVAIKVLPEALAADPERLARLQREARVLASLNHPNIASIHDVQEVEGRQLLILELVEGSGLDERIRSGPLPLEETLAIGRQIAEALENAHEKGIVHRDLKPANVKITPDGVVKVLDFGLAKAFETEGGPATQAGLTHSPTLTANMTSAGVLMGTAAYMSPEQARGQEADKRADVWAFGCVLFEMLAGRQTFQEKTVSDTLAAILKTDVTLEELPSTLPPEVRRLVERCLEKDSRQRLRDIGEARIALERALSDPEPSRADSRRGVPVQAEGRPQRVVLPWVLLGAVSLLALVLALVLSSRSPIPPRVVRASIPAPAGTQLSLDGSHPGPAAIAPDGTSLVFAVVEEGGATRLWIRDLDTLEARPLAGTEGAGYPFWSPDGRQIGFFADGKLKKTEAGGGAVLSLCDAPRGKGGTWNADGVIVFAPEAQAPLYRVAAAGGQPVPLTELDDENDEVSHRHPRFLPDGESYVFLARRGQTGFEGEDSVLFVGSLDGGDPTALREGPSQADFSDGHLFFIMEDVLMAQAFDPAARQFEGDAFPVAEDVALLPSAALSVFSVAGDTLVFLPGEATQQANQLEWLDRQGRVIETLGSPAGVWEVHLSPDERYAAVSVEGPEGGQNLWIWDLERRIQSRLTFAEGAEFAFGFSPDGSKIAYSRSLRGEQDVWVRATSGSGEEQSFWASDDLDYFNSWSPDGRLAVVSTGDASAGIQHTENWVLDIESGETTLLNSSKDYNTSYPMISPDGRWVLYVSDESGRREVYVTAFPAGGRKWRVSASGGTHPSWGQGELFYVVPESEMLQSVPFEADGEEVRLGQAEPLFVVHRPFRGIKYAPTADGQRFLVISRAPQSESEPMTLVVSWSAELDD